MEGLRRAPAVLKVESAGWCSLHALGDVLLVVRSDTPVDNVLGVILSTHYFSAV